MPSREFVDWSLAQRVGRFVAGSGPAVSPRHRARIRSDFKEFTRASDELVRTFTGLAPTDPAPDPIVLDRSGWIAANLDGFRAMIGPLTERIGATTSAVPRRLASAALGVQVGILLGYLSQKVLGQYDLVLATEGAGKVYFVGPNIVEAERRFALAPRDFRFWITLHEITHRTQFAGVPWLRTRVRALIDRAFSAIDLDPARLRKMLERGRDLLFAGPRAWREVDVMTLLMSDEQRVVLGEMQALMCVVEGHGNFVMNRIGAQRIDTFETLKRTIEGRRRSARGVERAFQRAIGMDMKYEQYALGERFMNDVAARAGMDAVAKVWEREENLPTLDDLRNPDRWLGRIGSS